MVKTEQDKGPRRRDVVLLAEDDQSILLVMQAMLEKQGYEVVPAADGKIAQTIFTQQPDRFSAVLLDWQMPNMTGIELLKWIKEQPQYDTIPVIMVTGMITKEHIREGINAGAFYYVTKPFDQQLLLSIIHAAITDYQYKQSLLQRVRESQNPFLHLVEGTFRFRSIEEGERLVLWLANASPSPKKTTQLSEIVINAVEHGNLGITYEEKTKLLAADTWAQEVQRRLRLPENSEKYVEMTIRRHPDKFTVLVQDQGPGFDFERFLRFDEKRVFDNHGRGIAMASVALDVEFLEKGNKVRVTIPF